MTKQERIEIIGRSEKCALVIMACFIVAIIIIMCVAFLPRSEQLECSYDITVKESVYGFPWWNITLLMHEDIPRILGVQLRYEEQWLKKHTIGMIFERGDSLTLRFKFNIHIASSENFILYVYFEHNYFMRIDLILPEEYGG